MTVKFSTQKSTVLPRIPASITDAATRGFLEDILKHLDRLNRDVRGDLDKLVAGDAALDHGLLFGLADDDHTQYFNTTRGDARFSQLGHDHASAYAALSHAHDDRYFTESESDLRYSLLGHNHDLTYAAIAHNHDLLYSAIGHDHDSDYSAIGHDHDTDYSAIGHDHDTDYSAIGHAHNGLYMAIPRFEVANTLMYSSFSEYAIMSALDDISIAMIEGIAHNLCKYEFDGTSISLIGNKLSLGDVVNGLAALDNSSVALVLAGSKSLGYYSFDGTDWALVGSQLTLPNTRTYIQIASLSATRIALIDASFGYLEVYDFNGSSWSKIGNGLSFATDPGSGKTFGIAGLNQEEIALVSDVLQEIRCYRFDGTDWALVGDGLSVSISGVCYNVVSLSPLDVACGSNTGGDVYVYRFDGASWTLESNPLNIGASKYPTMCAINGTDLFVYEYTGNKLGYYRFCTLSDASIATFDNTTNNVSIAKHGFAPKLPNDATRFLNGDGGYTVPNNITPVLKTADYTILDDDGYGLIKVNPVAGDIVITLPTVADNIGRVIRIAVSTTGGSVTVDGEGFETIDGLASIVLNRKYDYVEVCSDGTEWTILSGRASYSTGWINTADWTIRELGDMSITYDNKTGTFAVGEEIEEYTTGGTPPTGATGNKWVICADSGTVLRCKEAQGTGFATNDRWVVGKTSGAKAQVNGTSKNLDGVVTHSLGYYPEELDIQIWIGAAAGVRSYNVIPFVGHIGVNDSGLSILSSTDTSIKIQTGYYGIEVMGDNGSSVTVDNEDWYYSILVMKRW